MKLISKFIIAGIIFGIIFSLIYSEKYFVINGFCEKSIDNEILKKKVENENLIIITNKGIYSCKKNESKVEIKEKERKYYNIPINFERYSVESDERLKILKVDYVKEDKYYFKDEDAIEFIESEKRLKFYLLGNLKIENNSVVYKEKKYDINEFKKLEGIEVISQNESITFKKYLFDSSCLISFDYSHHHNILYYLKIRIALKDECAKILKDELKYSLLKIIEGEKYYEFPLLIEIENKTLLEVYIPLFSKIDVIEIEKYSVNPFNVENLNIIKLHSKKSEKVEKENYFKLFFIDLLSLAIIISFIIFSLIRKIKLNFFLLLSPLIFIFKFLILGIFVSLVLYFLLRKKINVWIFFIGCSLISLIYNPAFTIFFPFLSIIFSFTKNNVFIIILFLLSFPLFFFSELISLLFLSSAFLLSLRNLIEKES